MSQRLVQRPPARLTASTTSADGNRVDPFAPRPVARSCCRLPKQGKPPERLLPQQIADRAFADSFSPFEPSSGKAADTQTVPGPPTKAVARRRLAARLPSTATFRLALGDDRRANRAFANRAFANRTFANRRLANRGFLIDRLRTGKIGSSGNTDHSK